MKALKCAVAGGADAVYMGAGDFNARSKADNFGKDELRLAVSYCHDRGVRVYLTLNTLIKPSEFPRATDTARYAAEIGVDAFIVQDLAFAAILGKELPDMPLHASTQMGIHNAYGAAFAKKAGFDRVIFSREVLPEDMKKAADTGIETECFVHGAHCISFSGNCYFSALVSGYSGNRGKCLQLCRKKYTLSSRGKTTSGYMLSAKDICLISDLVKLQKAGACSLKIEGRLRSPEYVYTVTKAYRTALSENRPDMTDVTTVFNRGDMSEAYIGSDRPDIVWQHTQNNIGSHFGVVSKTAGRKLFVTTRIKAKAGDGFKALRRGKETGSAVCNGTDIISSGDVRPGDELRLTRSARISAEADKAVAACDKITEKKEYNKIPRINHGTMSDIVCKSYVFPDKCVILTADDRTDRRLLDAADMIIYAPEVYSAEKAGAFAQGLSKPVLLDLPTEARGRDIDVLESIGRADIFDGYVANNVYAFEMFAGKPLVLGRALNLLSPVFDMPRLLSSEAARADTGDIVPVYIRETLMNLTHCPARQLGQRCGSCDPHGMTLTDESRNVMPLRRKKLHYCYYELLNSRVRNISGKLDERVHTRLLVDARNADTEKALRALRDPYSLPFDERTETSGRWGKGVK